jgi:hypothetical protein
LDLRTRRSTIASGIAPPDTIIRRPSGAVASQLHPKMSFSIRIFSSVSCFLIMKRVYKNPKLLEWDYREINHYFKSQRFQPN